MLLIGVPCVFHFYSIRELQLTCSSYSFASLLLLFFFYFHYNDTNHIHNTQILHMHIYTSKSNKLYAQMLRIKAKASRKFIMQPKTCLSMQVFFYYLFFVFFAANRQKKISKNLHTRIQTIRIEVNIYYAELCDL